MAADFFRTGHHLNQFLGPVSYTHLRAYEKEAARAVNQMIALLEPAMILILALVVGSVVMAIMMPVFNMYSSML